MSRFYDIPEHQERQVKDLQKAFPRLYDATPKEINQVLERESQQNRTNTIKPIKKPNATS